LQGSHKRDGQASLELRDIECSPRAVGELSDSITHRIDEMVEKDDPNTDDGGGSKSKDGHNEESTVDRLARLQVVSGLRDDAYRNAYQALKAAGEKSGRRLTQEFPADLFNCEECPIVERPDQPWLAVAWPGFQRYEFAVGQEATDRFEALSYLLRKGRDRLIMINASSKTRPERRDGLRFFGSRDHGR